MHLQRGGKTDRGNLVLVASGPIGFCTASFEAPYRDGVSCMSPVASCYAAWHLAELLPKPLENKVKLREKPSVLFYLFSPSSFGVKTPSSSSKTAMTATLADICSSS